MSFSSLTEAQTAKKLHCATTHYPPFTTFHPDTSSFSGFDVEKLLELGKKLNIDFKISNLPWPRVLQEIYNDYYDCYLSVSYLPERSKTLDFTSTPMHVTHYGLFYLPSHGEFTEYNLKHQNFGILYGVPLPPQILSKYDFQDTTFSPVKKAENLYQMLLLNRIDGYIIGEKVGIYLQKKVKLNHFIFKDYELPTYLVFKKGVVDIEKINKALKQLYPE